MEQWKEIPSGLGKYEVSNYGRVRSSKILKQVSVKGYLTVNLSLGSRDRRKKIYVHIAVAEAFIGEVPAGMEVAHNDGNRRNNRSSNLRYDTSLGNHSDRVAHGTIRKGEENGNAVLSESTVLAIYREVGTLAAIAARNNSNISTVFNIRNGDTWSHLTGG